MAKSLERFTGQIVFRLENYRNSEMLCIKRGIIFDIKRNVEGMCGFYPMLISVKWDDGSIGKGYFDYGVLSIEDMNILSRGGLLSSKYPLGYFNEEQCQSLKDIVPLYKQILSTEEKNGNSTAC